MGQPPSVLGLIWRGYDTRRMDFDKSDKTISDSVDKLVKRFAHDVEESARSGK